MKQFLILISLFVINSAFGQQNCSCKNAIDKLITKIESDYPGFSEKTKDTIVYNSFKKQLREEANTNDETLCFHVLKKYISYFKDGHIWFSPVIALDDKEAKTAEFIEVNMDKFLKNSNFKVNTIEGFWEYSSIDNEEVNFKVGIIKNKNDGYTGFAIPTNLENSEAKRVLFKLFPNDKYESHFPDKNKHIGNYEIYDNNFLYFKTIRRTLIKEDKSSKYSEKQIEKKIGELQGFKVKQLSEKTVSITLPSFDYPFVKIINNLIKENHELIENSEYLIIDIRGNNGGTGDAFQGLLPYIMTNSIRDMWIEFLATPTLINGLESYIESIKDTIENQEEIKEITEEIKIFKKHLGEFVNTDKDTFTIQKVDFAKKSPEYVVILINKEVASSGEDFVIAAKQSKKVKLLGTPTYGAIDYASVREFDFGCNNYKLYLPTFRSLRLPDYPIDNIGIQPDIYLDKTVTDWVKFAKEYLEN